jgi:hypothetical protein
MFSFILVKNMLHYSDLHAVTYVTQEIPYFMFNTLKKVRKIMIVADILAYHFIDCRHCVQILWRTACLFPINISKYDILLQ